MLLTTEPDLMYYKEFAFSIDSCGLDQKQFTNDNIPTYVYVYIFFAIPLRH